ncbi:Crp/Fnr family transcriptional regulator [bacterium]|nr:Crp/Fnr family transcriptional regulator [bacterium]
MQKFKEILKPLLDETYSKELKRGDYLYHMGDDPKGIFYIEEGLVGLFHLSESAKESFLRVFSEGFILGHRSLFAEEPYHASSIALSKTTYKFIPKGLCSSLCKQHPEFLKAVAMTLAKDLRAAELRIAGLASHSAQERIAETLVYLKLKYPQQVWTRKEIAEYSGSTFESVTRLMSKLEEEGAIHKSGRDFEILNMKALLNLKH